MRWMLLTQSGFYHLVAITKTGKGEKRVYLHL